MLTLEKQNVYILKDIDNELIVEVVINSSNLNFVIGSSIGAILDIDFGDGTRRECAFDRSYTYTYKQAGTYIVKILMLVGSSISLRDTMSHVVKWGKGMFESIDFHINTTQTSIPKKDFWKKITSFSTKGEYSPPKNLFSNCGGTLDTLSLGGCIEFPSGMLRPIKILRSIRFTPYYGRVIPSDFLSSTVTTSPVTAYALFSSASNLEVVEKNAFDGLKYNSEDIGRFFYNCKNLKTLPEELFADMPNLKEASAIFDGCSSLEVIPKMCFANNPKMEWSWLGFRNSQIRTVGEHAFLNCTGIISLYCCYQFGKLTDIAENAYEGCVNVKEVDGMFSYCKDLMYLPQNLLKDMTEISNIHGIFRESGIVSIPENFFRNNTKLSTVNMMCINCKSLQYVPSNVFGVSPQVTTCSGMFANCSSLTHVADDIFDNFPNANSFSSCFSGCTSLISAPKLWEKFPNASGGGCYSGCTSLPWYDEIPSNWK